ncbi:flagellar hook-length control protein FliK [Pseudoxanthomonas beigongshangi]
MKADASGWLSGLAGNPPAGASAANGARPTGAEDPAPAFERLLRRASSSPRSERATATETRDRDAVPERECAKPASTDASAARSRDTRTDASRRGDVAASDTAVDESRIEHESKQEPGENADASAWLPAGLVLPMIPPLAENMPGSSADPGVDATDGMPALPLTLSAGLRTAGGGAAPIGFMRLGEGASDAATQVDAAPAGPLSFGEIVTTAGHASRDAEQPALPAATAPAALPLAELANVSEPLPPLLAAGLAALKDLAGDAGNDIDAPAPVSASLLGTPAPVSDHGLARTATVNPLTSMTPDLRGDRFGDTLGTQMTWMAEQKIGHAHIRVSPGDLGAIEVSLRLDGDRVHADFSSAQPEVRQALQDSLPKLREMLGQQGFQLAQADVGHRQQSSSQSSTPSPSFAGGRSDGGAAESGQGVVTTTVRTLRGLVDAYA